MAGFWDELGIAPTKDASTIRRAYATRLKVVRPDSDAQGFSRLRAAYERALAYASKAAPSQNGSAPILAQTQKPAVPDLVDHGSGVTGTTLLPAPPALPCPVSHPFTEHLRRDDVLAAAGWLATARTTGTLSLAADLQLADRLGWTMAQDRILLPDAVREAAERLDWPNAAASAVWAGALRARLDAERWLAAVRQDAASRKRWLGAAFPIAARILLGRGGLRFGWPRYSNSRVKQRYGEYLLHAAVIADQFDPVRIERIGRLLTMQSNPVATKVAGIFIILALAPGIGMLVVEADQGAREAMGGTALLLLLVLCSRRCRAWLGRTLERLNQR